MGVIHIRHFSHDGFQLVFPLLIYTDYNVPAHEISISTPPADPPVELPVSLAVAGISPEMAILILLTEHPGAYARRQLIQVNYPPGED